MVGTTDRRAGASQEERFPVLSDVHSQVAAGAAWLDETYPGWERKIDLSKLDLTNGCRCILGQLAGIDQLFDCTCSLASPLHMRQTTGFGILREWLDAGFIWDHGFLPIRIAKENAWDEAWISLIKERFDSGLLSG